MSWEYQQYSFGTSSAQPPTPSKTPTSVTFPSPNFHTPKNRSHIENPMVRSPTFAEEYSVFHSTPGRLTSSAFHHFVETTPRASTDSAHIQSLSGAGDISSILATNVDLFSPNFKIELSPDPCTTRNHISHDGNKVTPRLPKNRSEYDFSGQTATPPASVSKGHRKLAPKSSNGRMHNGSPSGHYGSFSRTPTKRHIEKTSFSSASGEFCTYPIAAPATAPAFSNSKSFWCPDANICGMGVDFVPDVDANTSPHRTSNPYEWDKNNIQMLQDDVNMAATNSHPSGQKSALISSKRQRRLATKLSKTNAEKLRNTTSMYSSDFNNPHMFEDPFSSKAIVGVDPGTLFGPNKLASMSSTLGDVLKPASRPATSYMEQFSPYQHQRRESMREQEELRRAKILRELAKARRYERGTFSSPIRSSSRPGLERSSSEGRVRRLYDRTLPRNCRLSPVKSKRLTSITTVPELPLSGLRTEVRFTIDAKGRATTETVIVEEEEPRTTKGGPSSRDGMFSHGEYSSDDEPIVLPRQHKSFALPKPNTTKLDLFGPLSDRRDLPKHVNDAYSRSCSSIRSILCGSIWSEAETAADEDIGSGDATLELWKVMESRKKTNPISRRTRNHGLEAGTKSRANTSYTYSSSSKISGSTSSTDADFAPTRSRGSTRCVCKNQESDGFMIECESCDHWLHAECVGIDRRSLPPVYICAYCALIPNMRRGQVRNPNLHANYDRGSSPLAHKSFKSVR